MIHSERGDSSSSLIFSIVFLALFRKIYKKKRKKKKGVHDKEVEHYAFKNIASNFFPLNNIMSRAIVNFDKRFSLLKEMVRTVHIRLAAILKILYE